MNLKERIKRLTLIEKIIVLNVIIFIIPPLNLFLSLDSQNHNYFEFFTYQFTHGGLLHILFNMFALYSLGPEVFRKLKQNKFLTLYLLGGIFAAITHVVFSQPGILVGASGSIMAILAVFTFLYPNTKLYLFFIPIGIKAKYLVSAYICVELYLSIFGDSSGISHWGHVGGFAFGCLFYLINYLKNR